MPWWKRLPFFYGWLIVASAFACFAVGYTTWHSFSIFYVALLEEFGWSRAATAAGMSVFTLVYGLSGPLAGGLVDRFGPRRVLPLSALVLGAGLFLTARISTLWQFYLLFGVVAAVGLGGFGVVVTFSVLNNWFFRRRGTAAGLTSAGMGVGTLLLVPFLQTVIIGHGWRMSYMALAAAIVLIVPALTLLFFRHRPEDLGLLPDGEAQGTPRVAPQDKESPVGLTVVDSEWASREWTLQRAVGTRRFWLVFFGRFLEVAVIQMFLVHQVAFLVDVGYDRLLAASVVGLVGIVGATSKVFWGVVSDRIGREMAYTLGFAAGTVGVSILLSIRPGSPIWMPYAYGATYALCYGTIALFPVLSGDIFQGKQFGSILGGIEVAGGLGPAVGAFLAGYVFDLVGSYTWAFASAIPIMWMACLLYWLAAPRKVRRVAGRVKGGMRPRP